MGATVSSVQKDFSAGTIQTTGKSTDMAIDGSGFFVVNTPDGQRYTRDGSFTLNSQNELVTQSGGFVQGYAADAKGNVATGSLQAITIPLGGTTSVAYTPSSAWTNTNLPFILQTASSVTRNDGRTAAATTSYAYTGGLWDWTERRFLGFLE